MATYVTVATLSPRCYREAQECDFWVHKKCCGIRGSLSAVRNYVCPRCRGEARPLDARPVTQVTVDEAVLDVEPSFCYLGDMLCIYPLKPVARCSAPVYDRQCCTGVRLGQVVASTPWWICSCQATEVVTGLLLANHRRLKGKDSGAPKSPQRLRTGTTEAYGPCQGAYLFGKKADACRNHALLISVDDKAYLRPGTSEAVSRSMKVDVHGQGSCWQGERADRHVLRLTARNILQQLPYVEGRMDSGVATATEDTAASYHQDHESGPVTGYWMMPFERRIRSVRERESQCNFWTNGEKMKDSMQAYKRHPNQPNGAGSQHRQKLPEPRRMGCFGRLPGPVLLDTEYQPVVGTDEEQGMRKAVLAAAHAAAQLLSATDPGKTNPNPGCSKKRPPPSNEPDTREASTSEGPKHLYSDSSSSDDEELEANAGALFNKHETNEADLNDLDQCLDHSYNLFCLFLRDSGNLTVWTVSKAIPYFVRKLHDDALLNNLATDKGSPCRVLVKPQTRWCCSCTNNVVTTVQPWVPARLGEEELMEKGLDRLRMFAWTAPCNHTHAGVQGNVETSAKHREFGYAALMGLDNTETVEVTFGEVSENSYSASTAIRVRLREAAGKSSNGQIQIACQGSVRCNSQRFHSLEAFVDNHETNLPTLVLEYNDALRGTNISRAETKTKRKDGWEAFKRDMSVLAFFEKYFDDPRYALLGCRGPPLSCQPTTSVLSAENLTTATRLPRCQESSLHRCREKVYKVGLGSLFTIYCPHGVCYGFEAMRNCESPHEPFQTRPQSDCVGQQLSAAQFDKPPSEDARVHQNLLEGL
ncbi:hypothetical protein Bbelb_283150 [Branchiostoma belcheri]|nr:hypothetical protein Bbelb_283150 [Branchiostoma belcheri]